MFKFSTLLASLTTVLLSVNAAGDEGVLEINQACALNAGCFAGDDPGFPVQIDRQGSYVLTSSLDVTVADDPPNTTAIEVTGRPVHINLNGFTIQGPAECSGVPVNSCDNIGSGKGIDGWFNTTVKNGTVRDMGDSGISISGGRVTAVLVAGNAVGGIQGSDRVAVEKVIAELNGFHGINIGSDSVVRDARASLNRRDGINVGSGAVLTNVTTSGNGQNGVSAPNGSMVEDSTSRDNGQAGILLRDSHAVGNTLFGNTGFGVECNSGGVSVIRGNMFNGNNGTGAEFNADCTPVAENVCGGGAC